MTLETDDMDLAGDMVQSLANYMDIEVTIVVGTALLSLAHTHTHTHTGVDISG